MGDLQRHSGGDVDDNVAGGLVARGLAPDRGRDEDAADEFRRGEEAHREPGCANAVGDVGQRAVDPVEPAFPGRQRAVAHAVEPPGEVERAEAARGGKPDLPAVGMADEGEVGEPRRQLRERLWRVSEEHAQRRLFLAQPGRVEPGMAAVGVVQAGDRHGDIANRDRLLLVLQDGHVTLFEEVGDAPCLRCPADVVVVAENGEDTGVAGKLVEDVGGDDPPAVEVVAAEQDKVGIPVECCGDGGPGEGGIEGMPSNVEVAEEGESHAHEGVGQAGDAEFQQVLAQATRLDLPAVPPGCEEAGKADCRDGDRSPAS